MAEPKRWAEIAAEFMETINKQEDTGRLVR